MFNAQPTGTVISRRQECEKASNSAPVISQSFQSILNWIWCMIEMFWFDESNIHFISVYWIFKGENPTCVISLEKKNVVLYSDIYGSVSSDIYGSISFRLVVMVRTTELYILIPVWMTLTFIEGHSCIRNQKLQCPFSDTFKYQFGWNSGCCNNLLVCWSSC